MCRPDEWSHVSTPSVCIRSKERGTLISIFRSGVIHALVGTEFKIIVCFFFRLGTAHGTEVSEPKMT